jgi:hypothetical protein
MFLKKQTNHRHGRINNLYIPTLFNESNHEYLFIYYFYYDKVYTIVSLLFSFIIK